MEARMMRVHCGLHVEHFPLKGRPSPGDLAAGEFGKTWKARFEFECG